MKTNALDFKQWFDQEYFQVLKFDQPEMKSAYERLHSDFATFLVREFKPQSMVELGSGMGSFLASMNNLGVDSVGYDINPFHKEFFDNEHPAYADKYLLKDFTHHSIKLPEADLYVSVEVLEHITMDKVKKVLTKIAPKCSYFYFTSTPNRFEGDEDWGHININSREEWIAAFEECGFEFVRDDRAIVSWGLIFKGLK